MKYAYDLYLTPETQEELLEMIVLADHMSFEAISISLSRILRRIFDKVDTSQLQNKTTEKIVKNTLKRMAVLLSKIGKKIDLTITTRITTWFDPQREEEEIHKDPLRDLTRLKRPYRNIIIAFKGRNEKEIRRALKYRRPYLVSISIDDIGVINKEIYNLSRQFYKPIEISLRELILSPPPKRGNLLNDLRSVRKIINKPHFKVIFSSGAREPIEMRSIRAIKSLLSTLGIKRTKIKDSYKLASEFLFQPKPAVYLDEENERNTDLIKKLEYGRTK